MHIRIDAIVHVYAYLFMKIISTSMYDTRVVAAADYRQVDVAIMHIRVDAIVLDVFQAAGLSLRGAA
jgi:hypothetical protein